MIPILDLFRRPYRIFWDAIREGCGSRAAMHGYVPQSSYSWQGCTDASYQWDGEKLIRHAFR